MKNFVTSFGRSVSDPDFYKKIMTSEEPVKVRFAIGLALISALITTIVLTIFVYTLFIPSFKKVIAKEIPVDMVLMLRDGHLSLNRPMPFFIPSPGEIGKKNQATNLVVIDTDATGDILENLTTYDTDLFISETMFAAREQGGRLQITPLKNFPDFTFTQQKSLDFIETASRFAWVLSLIAFLPIALVYFVQMLVVFLIAGFILWLILKIAGKKVEFKRTFEASMYLYTAVFCINAILVMCGLAQVGILISSLITVLLGCIFIFIPKTK